LQKSNDIPGLTDNVINITGAVVAYREDVALRGISLKVKRGEFIGIIGPNGAGKTTLLTIINALANLTGGSVNVLGHNITTHNGHLLRKKIGYVSQSQTIDPRMPMNVREVVMIGRYAGIKAFHKPGDRDWNIVDGLIETVGLKDLARRPIGHLSGGEQQRVAIARCLAQEPDLFLLDEPTAALDWRAKIEILNLVKNIHESRRLTTLYVTHDLGSLPLACDRVVMMKDGLIWGEGSPDLVLTDLNLSKLYDLPEWEISGITQKGVLQTAG
jgi:ABC-type cobalamin/Fe3+-siderophores transport system ATPase subunit